LPPIIVAPLLTSRVLSSPTTLYLVATQTILSFQARAPPLA
jgi:hypothetical protein